MRSRTALDGSTDPDTREERLRAELEDRREIIDRYERKLQYLQDENERLQQELDEFQERLAEDDQAGFDALCITLTKDKRTKRTVRFKEQTPDGTKPVLGTVYVKKWWLNAQDWTDRDELTVKIELASDA